MPLEDKQARLNVMREIARFNLDTTLMNTLVINQIAYLDGRIRRNHGPGAIKDLKRAMLEIEEIIKTVPGVQDAVIDVAID
jgi:hypothetical protein